MNGRYTDDTKPIVAILTMPDPIKGFRGNHANFVDIIRTGKNLGFPVYVVTVRDLKLSAQMVKGYTLNTTGEDWETQFFPLPQVIYNRIPQREDEDKPGVQHKISACLHHPFIRLYNPYFFNKWHLFEWLKASNSTDYLVPMTKKLGRESSLAKMLEKYSFLYLKPESGKAGKGIMMLKYQRGNPLPYRLKIQSNTNSTTYKAATMKRLWIRLKRETGNSPYIVQQGIELATVDNRRFDLRILVQKTGEGQWGITGVGARMAGSRSITTHVPRGGSIENPQQLLSTLFGPDMKTTIMNRAKTSSLLIARQIEKASGFNLGEMSMDLGIDEMGKIWFFEANAKPMKFDESHIRKRSLEQIFHYSQYLARQI